MSGLKYEVGGRVKISGKWFAVLEIKPHCVRLESFGFKWTHFELGQVVEAYEPPKPREWLTGAMWERATVLCGSNGNLRSAINEILDHYHGEAPEGKS